MKLNVEIKSLKKTLKSRGHEKIFSCIFNVAPNCRTNPVKMPSTPRTVHPLSLWFLSNVLMSRHLRLMIRLAMAVLFKWNALQSILLTFLIIKIK